MAYSAAIKKTFFKKYLLEKKVDYLCPPKTDELREEMSGLSGVFFGLFWWSSVRSETFFDRLRNKETA
jgi:hypothetical protein